MAAARRSLEPKDLPPDAATHVAHLPAWLQGVAASELPEPGADPVPPPLYVGDGYGRVRREP